MKALRGHANPREPDRHPRTEQSINDPVMQAELAAHAGIDRAFRALIERLRAGSARDARELFQELELRMRAHMHAEDALILGRARDDDDADELMAEHRSFEGMLDRLADLAPSGALTLRDVYELKARFTLHEAREETGRYKRPRRARGT